MTMVLRNLPVSISGSLREAQCPRGVKISSRDFLVWRGGWKAAAVLARHIYKTHCPLGSIHYLFLQCYHKYYKIKTYLCNDSSQILYLNKSHI